MSVGSAFVHENGFGFIVSQWPRTAVMKTASTFTDWSDKMFYDPEKWVRRARRNYGLFLSYELWLPK